MKPGRGKAKGGAFERKVCVALSLWVSHGKRKDVFWRSAMSGGRATITRRKGETIRQSGDICAVAPEGHTLTSQYYVECKHVRDLRFASFIFSGMGPLASFWAKALREAKAQGLTPMLIAKQNNMPTIVMFSLRGAMRLQCDYKALGPNCVIYLLDDILGGHYVDHGNGGFASVRKSKRRVPVSVPEKSPVESKGKQRRPNNHPRRPD